MSLRGRVGRHGTSGRQCQNWGDDQQQVIDLLNAIPVIRGGAAGSLHGRVVMGIASEALCQAILRFEDKQFPGQRSGFVDPGGAMWNRMLSGGVVQFEPFVIPKLFNSATAGRHFDDATL